jgi:5'-methylthioadenosine/S-adenosylhomocysteine nucleosidase
MRVVVITALEKEFRAMRDHLTDCDDATNTKTQAVYTVGVLAKAAQACDVCLVEAGLGNEAAAVETAEAISYFRPDAVVFVGIAGGLKDVKVGDVVAASHVWNYERAKVRDTELEPRADGGPCSYALVSRAKAVSRADRWKEGLEGDPSSFVGPIVAGDKVVAGRDSATFRAIKQSFGDALAIEMEGRGVLQAAYTHDMQVIDIRGIADMADSAKSEGESLGHQELAAKHAAAFAAELLDQYSTNRPDGGLPSPPLPDTPDYFPPTAARELELLRRRDPELYRRLIESFTRGSGDLPSALRELAAGAPQWLADSADAWIVLGYCAVAQNLPAVAAKAFERAALSGAQRASHWLAQAAVNAALAGDREHADRLLTQARSTAEDDVFVEAMAAAANQDFAHLSQVIVPDQGLSDEERLALEAMRAAALAQIGQRDQAYEELTRLHTEHPDRAMLAVQLAYALVQRAEVGATADRQGDLERARQLAIEARDLLRRRRMDSSPAVVIACQTAVAQGDGRTVLDLALASPEGEATIAEASAPQVLQVAVQAAILIGAKAIALRLIAKVEDRFWRAVFEGTLAATEPEGREAAIMGFNRALEVARDDRERWVVLLKLAPLGVWPLPIDPAGLQSLAPVDIDLLLARSELARGLHNEAISRLRRWSDVSMPATEQLADAYVQAQDPPSAVDVLRSGAASFQAPELLVAALDVARVAGRWQETIALGRAALEVLPASAKAAFYVRHRLVESAARLADWSQVETYARAQLRLEPEFIPLRWALVIALHNRTQLEAAWRALTERTSLEPLDEYQARIKIRLVSLFQPNVDGVQQILELADRFRESEVLVGAALMSIYTMRPQSELPPPLLAKLHTQTAQFFDRFPESTILRRVQFETPEQLLEQLAGQLAAGRDQLENLVTQVQSGRLPYGAVSALTGKLYAFVLATRGAGPLVGVPNASELLDAELSVAKQALGGTVVAETSVLSILVGSSDFWSIIRPAFHRILVTDSAVADAVAARDEAGLRSTLSLTVDPDSGRARPVEISPDEAERLASDTAWMAERALELEQGAVRELKLFPDWEMERFGAWASAVELAATRGHPLYSDDLILRQIAREHRVPAFGTYALAQALSQTGRLDEESLRQFDALLFDRFVVDLPRARELIEQKGMDTVWRSTAALAAVARPPLWADAVTSIQFFASLFQRIHREAPQELANWVHAAMMGGSFLPGIAARSFIAELLLTAILAAGSGAEQVPRLVEAARHAARRLGADDPLEPTAARFLSLAAAEMHAAAAAQFTMSVFAPLEEADRVAVMRVVADPAQRQPQQ